jgi:micrococcal nuclease
VAGGDGFRRRDAGRVRGLVGGAGHARRRRRPPAAGGRVDAIVERVVDGDTFVADRDGRRLRVRLIGLDAPESVRPGFPVECYGVESSRLLGRLLREGAVVRAAYESGGQRDRFGRELWDVWLRDGRFVQGEVVRAGAAEAWAHPPQTRYADELARIEDGARTSGAGLHGAC